MMNTLTIDNLQFETRWSQRRRTVEITVDRGGELIVHAPAGLGRAVIETFVRKKRLWISAKLAAKEHLHHNSMKEFKSGEGFEYLGRSYRLLLVAEQDAPLKLERGRFRLLRSETDRGREHFARWYTDHAHPWLYHRVEAFANRIGFEPRAVQVRDLGFRWGSYGRNGTLYFHWAVITMPPRIIDYIVVHELVHTLEPYHARNFWKRVERVIPDFEVRKGWLKHNGAYFAILPLRARRANLSENPPRRI